MSRRRSFILLSVCLIFLGSSQIASACGCYPHGTVLEDFDKSDVVLIARVVSLEKAVVPSPFPGGETSSAKLVVEKIFKGGVRVNQELTFGQGDAILGCTWSFFKGMIGRQYLFYLYTPEKPSDAWYVSTCLRSIDLEYASEDLLYLNNMNKLRGRTRISGSFDEDSADGLRLAGRKVRIVGRNKTYLATSDKNGVYEVYDVPPGKYVLEPELPFGWRVAEFQLTRTLKPSEMDLPPSNKVAFTLRPRKHFGIGIKLEMSNHVSGTVHDSSGKPLDHVCVSLVPSDIEGSRGCDDLTDQRGRFQIDSVEAGTYVVMLNNENPWALTPPLTKLYYPGVAEREKAETISIKHGASVENLKVVIPK